MKNKNLISIIVPIYNSETYLNKCIDSILNQTYKNLEIILVNDGSTDASGAICDVYAMKDDRIIVIHQENLGRTAAKKSGIKNMSGEFVVFIDSDDWIDLNMCEILLNKIISHNADMVSCNIVLEYGSHIEKQFSYKNNEIKIDQNKNVIELYEYLLFSQEKDKISPSLCNKLHKKTDILKFLSIPDDLGVGEDGAYIYSVVPLLSNIYLCGDTNYHYNRTNKKSIMNNIKTEHMVDKIKQYLEIKKSYESHPLKDKMIKLLNKYYLRSVMENLFITMPENLIKYTFPKPELFINKKVVLYGAGVVGQSYLKQFSSLDYINIINIIDENFSGEILGNEILHASKIASIEYDYILIAIFDDNTAFEIINTLKKSHGVNDDNIIWEKPISVEERIFYGN